MKKRLIAMMVGAAIASTSSIAHAGNGGHGNQGNHAPIVLHQHTVNVVHSGWHGGRQYFWRPRWGWWWGAPVAGALAFGALAASPFYGYGYYPYRPYSFPYQYAYPPPAPYYPPGP